MSTNVTIRNVPDDVRDELAARAASAGRSLQEHLLAELTALARKPSAAVILARIRARKSATGTKFSGKEILRLRDADRR